MVRNLTFSHRNEAFTKKKLFFKLYENTHWREAIQLQSLQKGFYMKSSLIIHARTHTGEKHYNCSYCNKDILRNNNLTNHKRTHTGDKHYSCSHCDQSFADSSSFRRHQIIHSGEKPYSCSHCNKAFAQKKTYFITGKNTQWKKILICRDLQSPGSRHCFYS